MHNVGTTTGLRHELWNDSYEQVSYWRNTNLQTNNDGNLNVEILGGVDDSLGDDVTPHDASEDIDEDGRYFWVRQNDFESFL